MVVLSGGMLRNNESLVVDRGASVRYELPAPLGHYIEAPNGNSQLDGVTGDFPFACAPGVSGASAQSAQNGPQCSASARRGRVPGTAEARPCKGGYHRRGSPLATPCPGGTYSSSLG